MLVAKKVALKDWENSDIAIKISLLQKHTWFQVSYILTVKRISRKVNHLNK